MPVTHFVCPHCLHHLRTDKPVAAGKRAHCPRCGQAFLIGGAPPAAPPPLPVAAPPAIRRSRAWLWAGIILGGVLVMMGTSVGLVIYLAEETPNVTQEEHAPSTSTGGQGNANSEQLPQETMPEPAKPPEPPWLPEQQQTKANAAIDRGLAWMRKNQTPEGSWSGKNWPVGGQPFITGLAALGGLTLLECGVPPDDPQVRKAVKKVRDTALLLEWTYEISLAILFLDYLQEEEDRPRIRSMALRLTAGQQVNGGWSYRCPILKKDEELPLLAALEKTRPPSALDLFQQGEKKVELGLFVKASDTANGTMKELVPLELAPANPSGELSETELKKLLDSLPRRLRQVPSLHKPSAFRSKVGDADNSNTQFAILALLVAQRYDVPLERALALIVHRFHATQLADGEWNYGPRKSPKPQLSMTGAGLLGMGVKYGLVLSSSRHQGRAVTIQDADIDKGLKALSEYIGHPLRWSRPNPRNGQDLINLYGMWSIERVGALYHLRRINGKEWYPWGVEQLLEWQEDDGAWRVGEYGGTDATDTCFALLFLRRADFARDLSKKLEFFTEGKELLPQR